ncbi:GNAT family N-acetyltransferase [Methylobacterium oryzisoli]|uniref:GNAT family N-acetyltransferase n=1 Tax=Methylobacterium oryzisoli TaxID=3385502 RepID=UPI00389257C9
MSHRDADGYLVRRLWPADRVAVEAHFRRLDRETRFSRFMGTVSEAGVQAYGAGALARDGVVYGAFVDGVLRGIGELRPMESGGLGTEAEAAFTVERPYRRRGLGTALATRLRGAARHAGVARVHLRALASNRALLGLAGKLDADLRLGGYEAHAVIPVAPPTPLSLWSDAVRGLFDLALAALGTRPRRISAGV